MQACLKLHHSILQRRRINVELTAGGGGKGEGRKEKIKERNERVGGQRERRAEREKEEGGEGGEEGYGGEGAGGVGTGHGRGWGGEEMVEQKDGKGPEKVVEVVNADGTITKVRGGRRVKAKPVSLDIGDVKLLLTPYRSLVNRDNLVDRGMVEPVKGADLMGMDDEVDIKDKLVVVDQASAAASAVVVVDVVALSQRAQTP